MSSPAVGPAELRRLAGMVPEGDLQQRLLADAAAQEGGKPCEDCGGTGTVATHVCGGDEWVCRRKCLEVQPCFGCLGTGKGVRA